ncbi:DUF2213 domain-containing protein [Desulfosporosinus sp. PR]|uniref:DUF2213 domain-containing protein n=1 Tax=Candidatus Desulfosporosinus nitrosoreducens TaxID=3401928 RepID=UPI0027FCCD4A|nr:DUF2213 domain-containing protein [Desulfosporosinus sp. PR]MDQ7094205.1 DUF2213 domain-containing protein [Desulfosporosinus sp. PR]
MNYYGDKISANMEITPEGYLICKNVPIGRTGWMEYFGREIPEVFGEELGTIVKVYRSPDELFSGATISSFEGKSVTNTHPSANLDLGTTPMTERGHAQNVRREGDFLVADLFVKDAGLISEIQNDLKREVSSGYDCSWHKIGKRRYEQREIIGNHVAIVPNGRAGPKVAIHDADQVKLDEKTPTGGKKKMGKITKNFLTALGFKAFAQDADPEDIAKAMDAMNEEDEEKKESVKDVEPEDKKNDVGEKKDAQDAIPTWAQALVTEVQALRAEVKDAKSGEDKETAESIMDATEEELEKPVKDEESEKSDDKKDEAKDVDPTLPEKSGVADAAPLKKFVQDMKPIIMAIPDEKVRLAAAKKFRAIVQDTRAVYRANGYADILGVVNTNRKLAMDAARGQTQTFAERAELAAKAWNSQGETMKGGK